MVGIVDMTPETMLSCPSSLQRPKFGRPSPNSSSGGFCRICHEGDSVETLVSPCKCTGTLALIHTSCLEHWLTASNTDKCEICKHEFQTTREPRPYSDYIQDSSNQFNVRNLVADVVCFFLLTPLLVVSTYLCIIGARQYFERERWEAIGLVILAAFLLAVYYTWCHVTLKYHIGVWISWKETNQRVRLVEVITCRDLTRRPPFVTVGVPGSMTLESQLSSPPATLPVLEVNEEDELNMSDTSKIIA